MTEKLLIKSVKIVDANSSFNNKRVDIFIDKGVIKQIGKDLNKRAPKLEIKNAIAMPGFCDLYADFGDPGFEHKEDIDSGITAALRGGYTAVCVTPNTHPIVQSKSTVDYILNKAKGKGVEVLPLGAATENLEGQQPTEMYDMQQAGAIGFTDAPHAIKTSGALLRALQYAKPFDGVIFDMATDESLANSGQVHEGAVSVRMGMKGVPRMAEVVQLKRNVEILRYSGGRLHVLGVTTKEGVDLIKAAKKEGLDITASVFVHHLVFTVEDAKQFDSNYKVQPPLRTDKDVKALKKGLLDGTIDCVCSQHTPVEIEGKKLEFEYATPGVIGLETMYAMLLKAFEGEKVEGKIAEWLSLNARKLLNKPATIDLKQSANFVLVQPKEDFDYTVTASKSGNSPLLGQTLKGKVSAVFHQENLWLND